MEEKEYSNVYAIPANYTDSGKLLAGMMLDGDGKETTDKLAGILAGKHII